MTADGTLREMTGRVAESSLTRPTSTPAVVGASTCAARSTSPPPRNSPPRSPRSPPPTRLTPWSTSPRSPFLLHRPRVLRPTPQPRRCRRVHRDPPRPGSRRTTCSDADGLRPRVHRHGLTRWAMRNDLVPGWRSATAVVAWPSVAVGRPCPRPASFSRTTRCRCVEQVAVVSACGDVGKVSSPVGRETPTPRRWSWRRARSRLD